MDIALLDLNYTLVENSTEKHSPFTVQIERERYRTALIEALAGWHVILVTARPARYAKLTLHSIESKTGWSRDEYWFNSLDLPPPAFKERALLERIRPAHPDAKLLAIESNPRTRAMYARHGVDAVTWEKFIAGAPIRVRQTQQI